MGKALFIEQLKALDYEYREPFPGLIVIDYTIDVGKFIGRKVELGFYKLDGFPDIPPGGPIFSTTLMPFNNSVNTHPNGGIHHIFTVFPEMANAPGFGPEWQYWSRPCNGWATTEKTIETYFSHLRHLLDTL